MESKKQDLYARLFGGIFATLKEDYAGEVKSPIYTSSLKMLDKFVETKLDSKILTKTLLNWINSEVLDSLKKDSSFPYICSCGYLELAIWFSETYPEELDKVIIEEALCWACEKGRFEVAKWLVEKNDVDLARKDWNRPLCFCFLLSACIGGNLNLIKWLLTKYPKDIDIYPYISQACGSGQFEVFEWFLETYTVDMIVQWLHVAIDIGNLKMCKLILEKEPTWTTESRSIEEMCRNGQLELLKFFLAKRPFALLPFTSSEDLLGDVCKNGHLEMARFLVQNYHDLFRPFQYKWIPVSHALLKGNIQICQLLAENYVLNCVHECDECLFVQCSAKGRVDLVKWFLDTFPETNIHAQNDAALRTAIRKGRKEIVKLLREHDLRRQDKV